MREIRRIDRHVFDVIISLEWARFSFDDTAKTFDEHVYQHGTSLATHVVTYADSDVADSEVSLELDIRLRFSHDSSRHLMETDLINGTGWL